MCKNYYLYVVISGITKFLSYSYSRMHRFYQKLFALRDVLAGIEKVSRKFVRDFNHYINNRIPILNKYSLFCVHNVTKYTPSVE